MGLWLPRRVMQGALAACFVAVTTVLWLCLSQPWLGLGLERDPRGDNVLLVRLHGQSTPSGDLPAVLRGIRVKEAPDRALELQATDIVEEPDTLADYAEIERFMDRQDRLHDILHAPEVTLVLESAGGTRELTLAPGKKSLRDLPIAFWIQISTGVGALLIGAWVFATRPEDAVTRLFALSGAMIMLSAFPAAIYSSRELAIDGELFRVLSALNHVGATGFGVAMIALFLRYPRAIAPAWASWLVVAIFGVWLLAEVLRLAPDQTLGRQLPMLLEMLLIIAAIGVQWFATRGDPLARAALGWLGLSVIVGAGAFITLITAPVLFDAAPVINQGHAFGFFLLIYAGLALGVARYRLFDLSVWSFRILFYTFGTLLLLAIDALLITVLHLHATVSITVALLAVGFIYLPLRGALWDRAYGSRKLEEHELFHAAMEVAFSAQVSERSQRWRDVLQRLFDPLEIRTAEEDVSAVEIHGEGVGLLLPAVAENSALDLRYAHHGQRLFGSAQKALAVALVRLIRHAEQSRDAYVRGGVEERARIARDLHDDIGARLLSGLYKTTLEDAQQVVRDAIADMRTIVSGLATPHPALNDMVAALRHETGERLSAAGLELHWPLGDSDNDARPRDYLNYRSFTAVHREMISNIIRHARARHVDVSFEAGPDRLVMRIADDGVGLSAGDATVQGAGNGIPGILRRMRGIGGDAVARKSARGMAWIVSAPLVAAPPHEEPAVVGSAGAPRIQGAPSARIKL